MESLKELTDDRYVKLAVMVFMAVICSEFIFIPLLEKYLDTIFHLNANMTMTDFTDPFQ